MNQTQFTGYSLSPHYCAWPDLLLVGYLEVDVLDFVIGLILGFVVGLCVVAALDPVFVTTSGDNMIVNIDDQNYLLVSCKEIECD